MGKELKEFSRVYLKKYGVWADICDKQWREDLKDYLYCLDLDKSINDDPNDRILFSLTFEEVEEMING